MAELSEQSAQVHGLAIAETRDVRNIVRRHQGSELDLNELRRRVLELELGLRGEEPAVALAERRDRFRRELLFALQTDARAFGEAEDVFGLDFAKRAVVVGVRRSGARQREACGERYGDIQVRAAPRTVRDSHRALSIRGVQGPATKDSAGRRRTIGYEAAKSLLSTKQTNVGTFPSHRLGLFQFHALRIHSARNLPSAGRDDTARRRRSIPFNRSRWQRSYRCIPPARASSGSAPGRKPSAPGHYRSRCRRPSCWTCFPRASS